MRSNWMCECGAMNQSGRTCWACGKPRRYLLMRVILAMALAVALCLETAGVQAGGCSLIHGRGNRYVTVSSGPCYVRDFPTWCRRYVPKVIVQGQVVPCVQAVN